MAEYKRRKYLIDKRFQLIFILKFCSLLLIGAILTISMLYTLSSVSTSVFFQNSRIVAKNTAHFIFPLLVQTMIIVTLIIGIVAAGLMLFSSHRISGPLFRLKREIDRLAEGQIPKDFRIRSKDQLQGIADSFDKMVRELNIIISDLKSSWQDLKSHIPQVIKETQSKGKEKEINEKINLIDKRIQHFKT